MDEVGVNEVDMVGSSGMVCQNQVAMSLERQHLKSRRRTVEMKISLRLQSYY
jgi:hypothetical protein